MKLNTRTLILFLIVATLLFGILVVIQINQKRKSQTLSPTPFPQDSPSGFGARINTQETVLDAGKLQVLHATPSGEILPYDPVFITLSGNPSVNQCGVSTLSLRPSQYKVSMDYQTITITPIGVWPLAERIDFTLLCSGLKQVISYTTRREAVLTDEQQFQLETYGAKQIGQSRAAYLKSHPYISQFPIERELYFMMYIESSEYIYVVSNNGTPFTREQQLQIENSERPRLNSIGVPSTTRMVFQQEQ